MNFNTYLTLIGYLIVFNTSFGQIGSIADPSFVGMDSRLTSIEFNGKLYVPRHGSLPQKDYVYKISNSTGQGIGEANIRPVELFVSTDSGKTWELASISPIFTSIITSSLKVQLEIYSENSLMRKISNTHFILTTEVSTETAGSTQKQYQPIIFLFKEDIRPNYYPVSLEAVFRPSHPDQSRVTYIQTVGNTTMFKFGGKQSATFTFDPDKEYEWMFKDSSGGFQGRAKN